MYHWSYLVYPWFPLLHQLHLTFTAGNCDTDIPATGRSEKASESVRRNPSHDSAEIKNAKQKWQRGFAELSCKVCHCLQEFKDGLIVFPKHRNASSFSHELPLESRAKVLPSLLISWKTGIAISVWGRKLQGHLAEDALVQSCPDGKRLMIQ